MVRIFESSEGLSENGQNISAGQGWRITVKAKTEKYQFVEDQGSWRLTYLTKHRLPCHMGWKPLSLFWRGCWWRWRGHRTTMTTTLSHRWRQGCVTDIVENIYLLRLRGLMLTRELGTVGSTVVWASGLGTVSQKDLDLSKNLLASSLLQQILKVNWDIEIIN